MHAPMPSNFPSGFERETGGEYTMLRNRHWPTTFQHCYRQPEREMGKKVAGVISPSENLPSKARKLMCVGRMLCC